MSNFAGIYVGAGRQSPLGYDPSAHPGSGGQKYHGSGAPARAEFQLGERICVGVVHQYRLAAEGVIQQRDNRDTIPTGKIRWR